jgi:hypothetical protein
MHIPLCHDLLEIAQAQRISKIPSNAQDDDFGFEMATLEQRWPVPSHERAVKGVLKLGQKAAEN